jgi:signal transduction histidine kinase
MIKSFFDSMTGRIFLILVAGIVVTATLIMLHAQNERKEFGNQLRTRHAAERAEAAILSLEAVPQASRTSLAEIDEKSGIHFDFLNTSSANEKSKPSEFSLALKNINGDNRSIQSFEKWGLECPQRHREGHETDEERHCQTIYTTLNDGTPFKMDVAVAGNPPPPPNRVIIFDNLLFLIGISFLSLFVAHIATKPLRNLAQAAQSFGKNIDQDPLSIKNGPREVRDASIAFNSMQTSIRSHIQERTYMLAAIAHDLQTPLTRLRLRLEKVTDDGLRKDLIGDLTDTQNMVREGLDYAQLMNNEEPSEQVDLYSLLAAICNDFTDAGHSIQLEGTIKKPINASPHALRRCISNLLENATKYGDIVHVQVKQLNDHAIITITDNGPGIPEDQLEKVFQPFKRLEDSRSRTSGGTGLGLTIARIIAGRHRGSIKLSNFKRGNAKDKEDSGLVATLELPIK